MDVDINIGDRVRIRYDFHPVGQGLFATGQIAERDDGGASFDWVYDCGTTSSDSLVHSALDSYALGDGFASLVPVAKRHLNLVVISHFDRDHISGMASLLARWSVDDVMVPFVPLWQRLWIAFDQGVRPSDAVMSYFVDPIAFIRSLPGVEIRRFLLIPPSGPEPVESREPGIFGRANTENDPNRLSVDEVSEADIGMEGEMLGSVAIDVKVVRPRTSVRLADVWEFVPYNDHDFGVGVPAGFREAVEARLVPIVSASGAGNERGLHTQIVELRAFYDHNFGDGALARNVVSLFLYAGPLQFDPARLRIMWQSGGVPVCAHADTDCRESILYTGDGYLTTPRQLANLTSSMTPERIARIMTLQVMHHGASGNWHEGVAASLSPILSVFSSDPAHQKFKHPHPEVVRDFLPFGPIQVDRVNGAKVVSHRHRLRH